MPDFIVETIIIAFVIGGVVGGVIGLQLSSVVGPRRQNPR